VGNGELTRSAAIHPTKGRLADRWVRPAGWGLGAGTALLGLYVAIVGAASRSADHVLELLAGDWPFVLALATGFGIQVGLYVYLRQLRRASGAAAGVAGLGTGTSTLAMVACCAHHATDIVPLLGLSAALGVAGFLAGWRVPLMALGVVMNLVGIGLSLRALRTARRSLAQEPKTLACKPQGGNR
jgi:hypothetical protein